ncbi:MAG: hypothetical protein ACR2HR_15835 [Euzebya sp.]
MTDRRLWRRTRAEIGQVILVGDGSVISQRVEQQVREILQE